MTPRAFWPKRDGRPLAIFVAWLCAVLILGTALSALHSIALPAAALGPGPAGSWQALHVLADDCECSSSVAGQLAIRRTLSGWQEQVVVIGEAPVADDALERAGFSVRHLTADQAEREGFQGAPWLVLRDPAGRVVYSGGYAAVRPSPGRKLEDGAIMAAIRSGRSVAPLPAFGCATSEGLRRQLDPLHLKY
jgi:hypothetical protein